MLPVGVQVPVAGLYSSALVRVGVPPKAPPATSTSPFGSSVAVSFVRAVIMLAIRSEEHTSELQSRLHLVCRLLLEKKKKHVLYLYLHKQKKSQKLTQ